MSNMRGREGQQYLSGVSLKTGFDIVDVYFQALLCNLVTFHVFIRHSNTYFFFFDVSYIF